MPFNKEIQCADIKCPTMHLTLSICLLMSSVKFPLMLLVQLMAGYIAYRYVIITHTQDSPNNV